VAGDRGLKTGCSGRLREENKVVVLTCQHNHFVNSVIFPHLAGAPKLRRLKNEVTPPHTASDTWPSKALDRSAIISPWCVLKDALF
jgi:hypothetical protein